MMDNFTESQFLSNADREGQSLSTVLSEAATGMDYAPRELKRGERPRVFERPDGKVEIEAAFLVKDNRGFFSGDDHGLIFPMLEKARQLKILALPIGKILNTDYHADIGGYSYDTQPHTASWERFGVDKGLWNRNDAFNFQPANSTERLYPGLPDYSNEIDMNTAESISPDVSSNDLDFFNRMKMGTKEYDKNLGVLKTIARGASVVMIFSSADWNFDYEKKQPYQSKEQIQQISNELYEAFVGK